jgi:hypothetical protein
MFYEAYYFYERCISFGIHPGPALYESLASAVEAICKADGISHIPHYADDSLLITSPADADNHYSKALAVFRRLGIPLSEDKLIPPSPSVEFLGIVIDCPAGQLRIPDDKLLAYRTEINAAVASAAQRSLPISSLHSLVGVLMYCCRCVQHGRLYLYHLQKDLTKALNADTSSHSDFTRSQYRAPPADTADTTVEAPPSHAAPGQGLAAPGIMGQETDSMGSQYRDHHVTTDTTVDDSILNAAPGTMGQETDSMLPQYSDPHVTADTAVDALILNAAPGVKGPIAESTRR